MGEGLRFSENGGESEPGDDEGVVCAAASSRYHKRHEMFSRRRPSFRDSLHFVNTLCRGRLQHGRGEDERGKENIRAQRLHKASSPSRSLTTSAATDRIGDGKAEIMVSKSSRVKGLVVQI